MTTFSAFEVYNRLKIVSTIIATVRMADFPIRVIVLVLQNNYDNTVTAFICSRKFWVQLVTTRYNSVLWVLKQAKTELD